MNSRKFQRFKVYSSYRNNIWSFDLAGMQLLSKYNKGVRFLLFVIDIYSQYVWVVSLKDRDITITNEIQNNLDESTRKPNKIWVDQGSDFYNRSMKSWLHDNDIKMYSAYSKGKSTVVETFIRTFKIKLYKHITQVDPKFKVGDHVRISKYKFLQKDTRQEIFVIKKVKNAVLWTYNISDLNYEEIVGTFCEKELQKRGEKEFRIKKVMKKKGDRLYVNWKGHENSFNSWIIMKDQYKDESIFP